MYRVKNIGNLSSLRTKTVIFSVASSDNRQNDRVYAPRDTRKRSIAAECLLRCRLTLMFSKSLMLSVTVSKLCSTLFRCATRKRSMVVITGTCYLNSRYCHKSCTVLLVARITPFQQDSALAHRARDTAQLLQQKTPEFNALWPPNGPNLNLMVDYHVCGLMQEQAYKTAMRDTADLKQRLIETWSGIPRLSSTKSLTSGLRLRACVKAKGRHSEHSLKAAGSYESHQMLPHC